jgi:hypothetical protein
MIGAAVGLAILGDVAFLVIAAGGGGGSSEPVAAVRRERPRASSTSRTQKLDPETAAAVKAFRDRARFLSSTSTVPLSALAGLAALVPRPAPAAVAPSSVTVTADPGACVWEPGAGGTLRAAGTVTNLAPEEDTWLIDVSWSDGDGYFDSESAFVETGPHQARPWAVTLTRAGQPAGPVTCAVEAL